MTESSQTLAYETCPQCGSAKALYWSQSSHNGKLRWHESVNCDACGLKTEADDFGFPPEEIRKRLIESEGLWQVNVTGIKSKITVLKVIREALALDMKEAARIARELPGAVYIGTNAESRWLVELLEAAGEQAVLTKM